MIVKLNLSGHQNTHLEEMGFDTHILHVDLADADLPNKVVAFLKPLINSGDTVYVCLPGLAPLASIVLVAIHGLSGHFPVMIPLVRGADGFSPATPVHLQDVRNKIGRTAREGLVML